MADQVVLVEATHEDNHASVFRIIEQATDSIVEKLIGALDHFYVVVILYLHGIVEEKVIASSTSRRSFERDRADLAAICGRNIRQPFS